MERRRRFIEESNLRRLIITDIPAWTLGVGEDNNTPHIGEEGKIDEVKDEGQEPGGIALQGIGRILSSNLGT
jgi:hypothetical protein